MNEEQLQELLERHCRELGEHFDAVQILTSRVDDKGNTQRNYYGSGNYFARTGMCHEFIGLESATQIANELGSQNDQ